MISFRIPRALLSLLASVASWLPVSASFTTVPDTITVIADSTSVAGTPPTVLRYVPWQPCDTRQQHKPTNLLRFSNLNADSISFTRGMPRWIREFINSWTQGDIDRTRQKRLDISFGIAPSYTHEASFGLGASATGLFRICRNDTLPQPSMFFAAINASLNGFYVFKGRGNLYFPDGRQRINFNLNIYRKALHFWGVTLDQCMYNPRSKYDRRAIDFRAEYLWRVTRSFYAGAAANIDYTSAHSLRNPAYLDGLPKSCFSTGVGLTLSIDTRDNTLRPSRGVMISYNPMVYPGALNGTGSTFMIQKLTIDYYQPIWRGAVLCTDLYGALSSASTPWTMRQMVASDGIRMRGYYMGSYMANNQFTAQVELRQHIWDRIGVSAWGGIGTMFSSLHRNSPNWHGKVWLPNYGVGLRFQIKHNLNCRADIGFGRHTHGVLFAVGEAF